VVQRILDNDNDALIDKGQSIYIQTLTRAATDYRSAHGIGGGGNPYRHGHNTRATGEKE
jgi:hypothetical protein